MQVVDNALVQAPHEVWQFKQALPSEYLPFGQDVTHVPALNSFGGEHVKQFVELDPEHVKQEELQA